MITREQAIAELERRKTAEVAEPAAASITPEEAKMELYRRSQTGIGSDIVTGVSSAGNQAAFGFLDEIQAGLETGFGYLGDYGERHQELEDRRQIRYEESPTAAILGGGIGAIAGGGGAGLGARAATKAISPRAARLAARNPKTALAAGGAAEGGLSGAGNADPGERLEGAALGAGVGAVAAPAAGALANKIANVNAAKRTGRLIKTSGQVKEEAQGVYKEIDEASGGFTDAAVDASSSDSTGRLRRAFDDIAARERLEPETTPPKVKKVLKVADRYINNRNALSASRVDALKRTIAANQRKAGAGTDEARLLGQYSNALNRWITDLGPDDFIGDASAIKSLPKADALWRKKQTLKKIESTINKAVGSPNPNAVIRNGFKRIHQSIIDDPTGDMASRFSRRQRAMIKKIAHSGSISRAVQAVTPSARSTLGGITGIGYYGAGGFPGAIGGFMADMAAGAIQTKNLNRLLKELSGDVSDPAAARGVRAATNRGARKRMQQALPAGAVAGAASGGTE